MNTLTEELRTSEPSTPGVLKVEARFCHDLHRCVKGTLIATIETIVFLPLSDCEQTTAPRQAAIEMRYEHVRSVAAYYDASVFVFTKRPSIKVLEKFLVDSNLGFASVTPMDNLSRKVTEGNYEKESEKSLNIPDAIGSLISRRMTLNFRSPELSITSSQSYVSRSLGRLMQRTVSAQSKIHSVTATIGDSIGEGRRHLSVGCSEELFSDHAAIYANPDTEYIDEGCGSI
ncbi:unnamed protein product, partial [Hydatigera taeniaeformis]|uniref:BEACH-type PH domain-containing protein n=1 Tax=Hydatigena taeniaeformis TaxID=6205 RepID=A0A0R3XB17_HYDTA